MKLKTLSLLLTFLLLLPASLLADSSKTSRPLPEFTQQEATAWLNSKPLKRADLKGKVVLVDIWTFDCWNCYRSFPWLNALEKKFQKKSFQVIGIHTPEFEHEKNRSSVAAKIKTFGLHHPVMMDNDFRYWKALKNRYWPTFYLVDKKGMIRKVFIGETHSGDQNAMAIENTISRLIAE